MSTSRHAYALPLKIAAILLLMLTLLVTVLSGIGIGLSAVYGIYDGRSNTELRRDVTEDYLYDVGYQATHYLDYDTPTGEKLLYDYITSLPELYMKIVHEDGTLLFDNYDGQSVFANADFEYRLWDYNHSYSPNSRDPMTDADGLAPEDPATTASGIGATEETELAASPETDASLEMTEEAITSAETAPGASGTASFTVHIQLWGTDESLSGSYLVFYRVLSFLSLYPVAVILTFVVALLLSVLLFVYLMCASGHHYGETEVRESFFDKIPFDVFSAAVLSLELLIAAIFVVAVRSFWRMSTVCVLLAAILYAPFVLILIGYFMSLATRFKTHRVLKNTLCWMLFSWIWHFLRQRKEQFLSFCRDIPLAKKVAVQAVILVLVNLLLNVLNRPLYSVVVMVEVIILGIRAIRYAAFLNRMKEGIHRIADGDLTHKIATKSLTGHRFKSAQDLNRIGDGLSHAVDERMKSEHFKTELITNVSHDIKTPLTSIINYVDLIKKSNPQDEMLCSYVDVLDRQSNRLKKLIEDLVEASKASSGVLPVTLTPCELGVLLEQVEGEYTDKLAARDLNLVVTKPAAPLTIQADGRHLGRIFDNLLNNIMKYAQPGTRVYLDATDTGDGHGVITFRNTSGAPLNIPAEALMERFVRGDASRHTEGSGLGLSIVQSLTELQGGRMELIIDGDLFKVRLYFPGVTA